MSRVGGDQVQVDGGLAPGTDAVDVGKNAYFVAAVDVKVIDAVMVEVMHQLSQGPAGVGVVRSGDFHGGRVGEAKGHEGWGSRFMDGSA